MAVNIFPVLSKASAPSYAAINAATNGAANTIVTAVNGQSIYVVKYGGICANAVNLKFQSFDGASTYTDLQGLQSYVANQPLAGGGFCPAGLFATKIGEALTLNLSGAVQVSGQVTYYQG